jgi:hypothetical protein
VDPLLYGFEFVFAAIVIYCVLTRTTTTPIILCVFGAISWFGVSLWLRSYKVRSKPPASSAHLSLEQRQQRIRAASWIFFGGACFWIVGAIFMAWLQRNAGRWRNIPITLKIPPSFLARTRAIPANTTARAPHARADGGRPGENRGTRAGGVAEFFPQCITPTCLLTRLCTRAIVGEQRANVHGFPFLTPRS